MRKSLVLFVLCISLAASVCAQQSHFDGKSWWNYVKVLADDNMEGRETGSAGLKKAEAYVVDQLKKDGLQPAGSNGFYQAVKFESRELDEKNSSLALVRNGKPEPLALGDDAIFSTRIDLAERSRPSPTSHRAVPATRSRAIRRLPRRRRRRRKHR